MSETSYYGLVLGFGMFAIFVGADFVKKGQWGIGGPLAILGFGLSVCSALIVWNNVR
jgi:hypothetical protein